MMLNAERYLAYFPQMFNAVAVNSFANNSALSTQFYEGTALWVPPGQDSYHPKDDDCWYLAFIGVDPDHQNIG